MDSVPDDFSITFDYTECALTATNSLNMWCTPEAFLSNSYTDTLTVAFNGKSASVLVQVGDETFTTTGVSPENVSPVLQTELLI